MRWKSKLAAMGLAAGVVLVALAAPASAHVSVNPSEAPQGSFTELAFRVPNEKDSGNTVKVDVQLPPDHPIGSVSVKPKEGWTYVATTTPLATPIVTDDGQVTEAVSEIVWTATGDGIKPGEFDDFEISLGPLPTDTDALTFKALQTYSDGDVVSWIEEPDASGAEPAHPAPVLTLTPAASDDHHASSSTDSTASSASSSETAAASTHDDSDDKNGRPLAFVALAVGIVGVVLGAIALSRSRKSGPTAS